MHFKDPKPHRFELSLLGTPQIRLDGQPVSGLAVKSQAVLFYLALTREPQPRATLASLLWGNSAEKNARTSLRKSLQQLRSALPAHIKTDRQIISLQPDEETWIDVVDFESRMDHALATENFQALEVAVQLWRGDFLSGFYPREAPDFESWMLAQQARLKEMLLHALQMLTDANFSSGDLPQAVAMATRIVQAEPWREDGHRQLMELIALTGDRGAALMQFEQCRQVLANELDVDPDPLTSELAERIRSGEFEAKFGSTSRRRSLPSPLPTSVSTHNLPAPTTELIGRKEELSQLGKLFEDPNVRLISILGPGGVGKTRLALAAAWTQQERYTDGPFWIPLTPVANENGLIDALGKALHLTFHDGVSRVEELCRRLRGGDVLLLFDSFEHLIGHTSLLDSLLEAVSNLKIVVTTRERLNLYGEWTIQLDGLLAPPDERLQSEQLKDYSSVALFIRRAVQMIPAFSIDECTTKAIVQICRLLQGLPLAIELAASLLRTFSCVEIAEEIEKSLDILSSPHRNMPQRHRSLHAVFESSWRLLTDDERRIFAQLSIFRGTFSRDAALHITDASLTHLSALVDKSLLNRNADGTYEMHELVKWFATRNLRTSPDAARIADRHERYYVSLSERDVMQRAKRQLALDILRREMETKPGLQGDEADLHSDSQEAIRILIISPEYPSGGFVPGGLGKHVAELTLALCQVSIEGKPLAIDVVAPSYAGEEFIEQMNPLLTIHRVPFSFTYESAYANATTNAWRMLDKADQLIGKINYALLHIHDPVASMFDIGQASRWRLPIVVTVHATTRRIRQQNVSDDVARLKLIEQQSCAEADKIIVTSSYMSQEIQDYLGVHARKIVVIPNGITVSPDDGDPSAMLSDLRLRYSLAGERLLFFIGLMVYEKGLLTLIRAMPNVLRDQPNVRLLVAGLDCERLKPLAYELNVEHTIDFLGFIDNDERDNLYRIVDALIIPSIYEPFGLVALEAMAAGCPIIASRVGGLQEVVVHQETGLLVSPNRPEEIVQAIKRLFADPVGTDRRRQNALHQISTRYRWDRIATSTANVYASLISEAV